MASNWFHYRLYKKVFREVYNLDLDNPVSSTGVQCDQYLMENTDIKRTPLMKSVEITDSKSMTDTFSLVMNYINKEAAPN